MGASSQKAKDLFVAAVKMAPDQWDAFLAEACGEDDALRGRVRALLHAHQEAASFLESPAPGVPSPVVAESADVNGTAATFDQPHTECPGTVIGPFKLLEQIGEGGFGVVFMAEQQQPVRRKVALKVLKPGMDTRQVVARFEAERQALAIMDHPHIAKVYDGGATHSGRPYFVMELIKGIPMTDFCDQHQLTPRQRLELFVNVCQAVQHAHQKGIIHRDLKPSNVLVTVHDTTPIVKVIDFGVAKALGQELTDKSLFTGFEQLIGTPLYMSPEQAGHSGLDIDTRSDIYSLGVLLYELLTDTTPFTKERFHEAGYDEIRRIIREEEPPTPSTRLRESNDTLPSVSARRRMEPARLAKIVRGELDWIVMKALEKDRNRRYESAGLFALDVQRYLADEPVQACPPSAWYRLRKFARRNSKTIAVTAVVALALTAVAAVSAVAYRNELRHLADQAAQREQLAAERRQNALEKTLLAAMSGDFDGADNWIGEAELLGASTGQVRMLRGQLAFHRGDTETAIQHLKQAVELLPAGRPGAVAARALLALAYAHAHYVVEFDAACRELEPLVPDTPEDYLFKGQVDATILFGHEPNLETLDEAIRRRPDSPIVRLARSEARANRALLTGELPYAESALEDAQIARAMLPGNPLALARSIYVALVAAGIYEELGRAEDRDRVLAQAGLHVQELEGLPFSRVAAKACFEYFHYLGDEDAALSISRRGVEFREAVMLYRRGEFAQALQAIEHNLDRGRSNFWNLVERGFILAESRGGSEQASAAADEARMHARSFWQVGPPMILLFLGQKEEAVRTSLQIRENRPQLSPRARKWFFTYLDYTCGLITEEELLEAAQPSRPNRCEAHFAIGLRRLAEGDRAGAREQFQQCVDSKMFIYWDYYWARAFLHRIEEDPAWPAWIPMKE